MTAASGKSAALQIEDDMQAEAGPDSGFDAARYQAPIGEAANEALPPHVRIVDSLKAAAVLHERAVNLAIRHRDVPEGLGAFIDAMVPAKLPNDTRTVATSQARAAVAGFIAQLWPEPTLGRQLLCHDVSNLVEFFADIAQTRRVRISVIGNARREAGIYRPIGEKMWLEVCYRGPSLDWLPEGAADRELLETEDNDLICDDPSAVRGLPRFAVTLMKGEKYAGNAGRGLIVREPEVSADEPRLAIRLDCS